jgi:Uma2 family endonuclease
VSRHGVILKRLFAALLNHEQAHPAGEVFVETPFVLVDEPGWVKGARVPDLMFFAADRLDSYRVNDPDWGDKPFVLVPDLAVEILSPTDRFSDVQNKVDGYLRDGVQLVWVVDSSRNSVTIYHGDRYSTRTGDANLTADDLLPGLSIPLSDIFAK